jgi:tRNA(fMet)-specific endonuclease VapC
MYLLDTDTIIFALKAVPQVVRNFASHAADPKALSVVTYGELVYGALKSARSVENLAKVRRTVDLFPVIDVNRAVMDTFGTLKVALEKKGKTVDDFDLLIASTALLLNYKLVTNNEKRFSHIPGLAVENWTKS